MENIKQQKRKEMTDFPKSISSGKKISESVILRECCGITNGNPGIHNSIKEARGGVDSKKY